MAHRIRLFLHPANVDCRHRLQEFPIDLVLGLPLLLTCVDSARRSGGHRARGLFLGAYAAIFLSDFAAAWLDERFAIGHEYSASPRCDTFIAVVVGVHLLGRVVEKMVDLTALKPMDRLGGLAFATGQAWLFWSIVVLLIRGTIGQDVLPADWC